jgi:hypothetical protein
MTKKYWETVIPDGLKACPSMFEAGGNPVLDHASFVEHS